MHLFEKRVNPNLGSMLRSIDLDKSFTGGKGCYLYDDKGQKYLDLIAAYGALPFGHNPPEIWQAITRFYQSEEPIFIQPSALNAAGELADKLISLTPDGLDYVTFGNSGAEAVEAAIKLCRSATGRIGILSTHNSFHGKTMGALSATGKPDYQESFGAPIEGFGYVEFGNGAALAEELAAKPDYYAALFLEPIQGEGGIVEPPPGYLVKAKEICEKYGVLLVLDEVQTGLGRTGKMFALEYEEPGFVPHVLLLAKALGGGVIPIGACISSAEVYNEDFATKHSTTFGGNSLACRIALQAIAMITGEETKDETAAGESTNLLDNVNKCGEILKTGLLELQKKHPQLILSVRGRGLLMGIQFAVDRNTYRGSLLGIMGEQEMLTPVLSSYLMNVEKLRVAPTLNGNDVIRIEPPLTITPDECRQALAGISRMLDVLETRNTAKLLTFLAGTTPDQIPETEPEETQNNLISEPTGEGYDGHFAFLVHPVLMNNYYEFDSSLGAFNEDQLRKLASRWSDMVEPFVISQTIITSETGKKVLGEFICIPRTAEDMMDMPRKEIIKEIGDAVLMAHKRGAGIVGLGAFTSVITLSGTAIRKLGIPITSGNSYTVVSAVEAVTRALEKLGETPADATIAVVGAAGSIGKGLALLLAEKSGRFILVGNPKNQSSSMERLRGVAAEIYRYISQMIKEGQEFAPGSIGHRLAGHREMPAPDAPISEFKGFVDALNKNEPPILISTAINEVLPSADVVISATNSIGKLIGPDMLKEGAVVCDISQPPNVSEEVQHTRPDVLVIEGGVVEVPGLPSLGWNFGFDKGHAFACMTETFMLAMEGLYRNTSIGASGITLDTMLLTRRLAEKHGFRLANFKSFGLPLEEEAWERVLKARKKKPTG